MDVFALCLSAITVVCPGLLLTQHNFDDFAREEPEESNIEPEPLDYSEDIINGRDDPTIRRLIDDRPEKRRSPDPDGKGVIYTRVSTRKQLDNNSLKDQTHRCREAASSDGLETRDEVISDKAKTGRDFDRKGIRDVIDLAEKGEISPRSRNSA